MLQKNHVQADHVHTIKVDGDLKIISCFPVQI